MTPRPRRWVVALSLAVLAAAPARARGNPPTPGLTCPDDHRVEDRQSGASALCVVSDRVYREGGFVIVDAAVQNVSPRPIARAEVEVEFYTDSGTLAAVQDSTLVPDRLEPGQKASDLVVTPYPGRVDRIRYRVTWQEAGKQYEGTAAHAVALG